MNKFAITAATAALMLSLSAGALAASGLGSVTTMSGAGAEADKAGSVTINTTMCALELDDAGKITAVSFDIAQNKVGFDATGALTGELTGEHPTKKELGDGYGMKAASGIGKEWFEQAEALEDWCVGKTVEEVVHADLRQGRRPPHAGAGRRRSQDRLHHRHGLLPRRAPEGRRQREVSLFPLRYPRAPRRSVGVERFCVLICPAA